MSTAQTGQAQDQAEGLSPGAAAMVGEPAAQSSLHDSAAAANSGSISGMRLPLCSLGEY